MKNEANYFILVVSISARFQYDLNELPDIAYARDVDVALVMLGKRAFNQVWIDPDPALDFRPLVQRLSESKQKIRPTVYVNGDASQFGWIKESLPLNRVQFVRHPQLR